MISDEARELRSIARELGEVNANLRDISRALHEIHNDMPDEISCECDGCYSEHVVNIDGTEISRAFKREGAF